MKNFALLVVVIVSLGSSIVTLASINQYNNNQSVPTRCPIFSGAFTDEQTVTVHGLSWRLVNSSSMLQGPLKINTASPMDTSLFTAYNSFDGFNYSGMTYECQVKVNFVGKPSYDYGLDTFVLIQP